MDKVIIDGRSLTLEDIVKVARLGCTVELSKEAAVRVEKARALVERFVKQGKVEYGITTGFGKFANVNISPKDAKKLQKNLIMSHACGVGKELDIEIVRAIMLLRANAISKGYSGARVLVIKTLLDMLNKGVTPVVYEKGSLGSSGDLAPLAHMVLVMIGEGEAYYNGERMSGAKAMELAGIGTIELVEKEGLALINGTQVMTAIGALAVYDAINLSKVADITAAMTCESLRGITDAYYHRVHDVRPQVGQGKCANNLLKILNGSSLTTRQGDLRVQDAYTLRCVPQIHGASKDAIDYVKRVVEIEINSATDNPLIFEDEERVISGGNFHGQPIALAMDFLGIALSEFADVAERRIERLVNSQLSVDLPAFLTEHGGLNSGFMIAQYVAAALVSENKVLAHPASVDSIPSSMNQEDHVSMGTIAARKARSILYNVSRVLGIEYLAAAQALYLRGDVKLGDGTGDAYKLIRQYVEPLTDDRIMYVDINKASELVSSGKLVKIVETKVGELYF